VKTEQIVAPSEYVRTSIRILHEIFKNYHPRDFAVRFWDGTVWNQEPGFPARFTLVIQHPGALRKMFLRLDELSLGEAYIYDDFNIEGDIEAAFRMAEQLLLMPLTVVEKFHLGTQLLKLPSNGKTREGRQAAQLTGARHSKERDRQAVSYHYNVSNDFFSLWLDPQMIYSCAYFNSLTENLNLAQERKLDYICRKLRLKEGDRLLDVGCGWGGLIRHAAKRYGVRAVGVTLSEPQAQLAMERIQRDNLAKLCKVEICDYRDIEDDQGFDKIVSVGMFEHVGQSKLQEYFEKMWGLLKPGGTFLNHGIAKGFKQVQKDGGSFADKYVFPDSQLLPIYITLQIAEKSGFEVRDVENLREHYMLTLRTWLQRLEKHYVEAVQLTDETTYRIWRLNNAGSAFGFESGRLAIFQTLLLKSIHGENPLPLTRGDWYQQNFMEMRNEN
jgi:cyclopropane-fatty-acyl-phospholipid synthase